MYHSIHARTEEVVDVPEVSAMEFEDVGTEKEETEVGEDR